MVGNLEEKEGRKMVQIRATDQQKNVGSGKVEVGEIDTRAPFQSVKAAVTLFAEVANPKDQPNSTNKRCKFSFENLLDKEAQLLLARRDVGKYKVQLEMAETKKTRASSELDKAKIILNDLTTKLKSVNESKLSALKVAEEVKKQAKQLKVAKSLHYLGNAARKQELHKEREQYSILKTQLDAAKQELTSIRQDFDAALDAKAALFQQAAEAQRMADLNTEKVDELVNEIRAMQETDEQLKLVSMQVLEREEAVIADKEGHIQACKMAKEEVGNKLKGLRQEYDPETTRNLETKLVETTVGIETLQQEMRKAHNLEMSAVKNTTAELNEATKLLQEVVEQEGLLRSVVASLKLELERVKNKKAELEMKESEADERRDSEGLSDEQRSMMKKLSTETDIARREVEEIKKNSEKLKQEAEKSISMSEEGKRKLEIVLSMIEQAKVSEKRAYNEMKMLSENPAGGRRISIRMPAEELEKMKKKVEECQNTAQAKEAEAMNEVEASSERKRLKEKRTEENLKAIEEIKQATEIALKSAEMSEAAHNVVNGELRKWRQKDHN